MSYFYIRQNKNREFAEIIRDRSEEVLIDSGAHSFQKGTKVSYDEYTQEYADWIKRFDRKNVLGYFEMDADNIIGYNKVLQLREVLLQASDKIIPVWHKNRGLNEFKKMCREFRGKIVAITGFKNEDIKDSQYLMFLKYAKQYDCKVHCLGMTRKKVLDVVPFDYTDSSTWLSATVYGNSLDGRKLPKAKGQAKQEQFKHNYLLAMDKQIQYYEKWGNTP